MKSVVFIISLFTLISAQAQDVTHEVFTLNHPNLYEVDEPYEGKIPLGKHEIPEKVLNAFQASVFQHSEIIQVFLIQDEALPEATEVKSSDQLSQLYEFQLRSYGKFFRQYFTAEGDLYAISDSV